MSQDQLQLSQPEFNVRQYFEILRRRKLLYLALFIPLLAAGVAATAIQPPVYQAEARFKVPTPAISLNIYDSNNPIANILLAHQPDSPETQLQTMQTPDFLALAFDKAGYQDRPGIAPPQVAVRVVDATNIISVVATGGHPEDVAAVANAVVQTHKETTDAEAKKGIKEALEFIRKQREAAREARDSAQGRLIQFSQQYETGLEAIEQAALVREHTDLQARIRAARANIRTTETEIRRLKKEREQTPLEIPHKQFVRNARRDELENRLAALEIQLDDDRLLYGPKNQRILNLEERIRLLRARIANEPEEVERETAVPNTYREYLQQRLREQYSLLQGFRTELHAAESQAASRPRPTLNRSYLEVRKNELAQLLNEAQQRFDRFDEWQRDLRMREIALVDSFKVIQPAQAPGGPIQPRKTTNLLMALALALVGAAMLTIAWELLDDRVHTPADIPRITALPCLSAIPLIDNRAPRLVTSATGNSHLVEAFRRLRSSIGFAAIDAPIRRILVTSAAKGEGKSVISVNLASVMAMDGKRVILVDADLRRPKVHDVLDLPNNRGLSQVLVGHLSLQEALQETDLENLHVITAGPIPPNPPELLGSRAFEEVMDRLEQLADVVIFDSPPCIPVTDPLLIASRVDGVLLVMHVGQSRKGAVRQAEEMILRARGRILGVVLNRLRSKGGGYYYDYGYYASYHEEDSDDGGPFGRMGRGGPLSGGWKGRRAEREAADPLAGALERRAEAHD